MNVWSLSTGFYLAMENRWFFDEKLQFENNGCKNNERLVSIHPFLPYDGKPMVFLMRNSNLQQRM